MLVNAWPVSFVVRPETIIHVAVNVDKLALAVSSVLTPFPRVLGSIGPRLLTKTISKASFPLTLVNCASFELVRRSVLSWLVGLVDTRANCFTSFLLGEVLARTELFRPKQPNHASGCVTSPPSLDLHNQLHILFQQSVVIFFIPLSGPLVLALQLILYVPCFQLSFRVVLVLLLCELLCLL